MRKQPETIRWADVRIGDKIEIIDDRATPMFDFLVTHEREGPNEDGLRSLYSADKCFWTARPDDQLVRLISRTEPWWKPVKVKLDP